MGQYSTRIDICQAVAMKVGTQTVTSIENPKTVTESRLSFLYDKTRRSVLRSAVWNFAQNIVDIPSSPETPPTGFSKVYTLPNDLIRYMGVMVNGELVVQTSDDFLKANGKIYQKDYSADSLTIMYIKDAQDVKKFDDLFIEAFVLKLAYELCFIENQKSALTRRFLEEFNLKLAEAKAVSAQEQKPRRVSRSRWLSARRSVGTSVALPYRYTE